MRRRLLHRSFVKTARRHPLEMAFGDATHPRVRRLRALAGAVAMARALRSQWQGQSCVGILLPPCVASALANIAAALAGRVTVNLNYTIGRAGMESAVRQAGLQTVLTSKTFLHKAKLEAPTGVRIIWAEDLPATIGQGARLLAFLLAVAAPVAWLERLCGMKRRPRVDDLATIVFSSGSTGEPKGVMLSHFNVDANVTAAAAIIRVSAADRVLGILPMFHAFGNLIFWFASNYRVAIVFHPNPLDAAAVGQIVESQRITFLLGTPTVLQLYLRRCTPRQFASLRAIVAGAEKLPDRLARAFEERFGLRPLEGYGTTECSPVVAVMSPADEKDTSRHGSVGRPLPGVSVRVVHPETFEPLECGRPGMLLVAGPNVMRGYLGRDDLTAKVMRDGWYVTGDIGLLDADGYLRITDRLSRFSKIGGEMIPHGTVEQALQDASGSDEMVFAVTAVPDERRGEQLAVLHTLDPARLPAILKGLASAGLSNLYIPRPDHFVKVDEIPILGTGKPDLRRIRQAAAAALGGKRTSEAS